MTEWLKFFGLSFFSDKKAREAVKHGFGCVFLGLFLAFLFFFASYLGADVVPFSSHYNRADIYREFTYNAFTGEKSISLTISEGKMYALKGGEPAEAKVVNTYTSEEDGATYAKGGYNLIVDTRPATLLIEFSEYAVNNASGAEISYEEYRGLAAAAKDNYSLKFRYTDEELYLDAEKVASFERFFAEACNEQSPFYSSAAAREYGAFKENGTENYEKELYYLYVRHYYSGNFSAIAGAKAPVLRDYYLSEYIGSKSHYLYVFGDMLGGSFETNSKVPVVFGGYFANRPDGAVVTDTQTEAARQQLDGFMKDCFYSTVKNMVVSYFVGAFSLFPLLVMLPILAAAILYAAGKALKVTNLKTFAGCYKTVSSFVWFSALAPSVLVFWLGFAFSAGALFKWLAILFTAILVIRSAVYCITSLIKQKKHDRKEEVIADKSVFGEYEENKQ